MCLCELWLAILAGAAGVFVASAVIWMATPLHKKDYRPLPSDAAVQGAVSGQSLPAGRYMFPNCLDASGKPMDCSKLTGPFGLVTVFPGPPRMGKGLSLWFLNNLVVMVLVGYVASLALGPGAPFGPVFRVTATTALLAYGAGVLPRAIWEGLPWRSVPAALVDAVVYALATGVLFAVLWP
jgi:hypothetical protein